MPMENPPFVSIAAEYGPFIWSLLALATLALIGSDPDVSIRAKALWAALRRRWCQSRE